MFKSLKFKNFLDMLCRVTSYCLLVALFSACAHGSMGWVGKQYLYGFHYDSLRYMRNIQIQDCEFQNVRPSYGIKCRKFDGFPLQHHWQSGYMYPPSSLYVKWRDLKTHIDYEAKADLRAGIPKDFKYEDLGDIVFVCEGDELEVYLVTKQLRPAYWPMQGPHILQNDTGKPIYLYRTQKVLRIASVKGASM